MRIAEVCRAASAGLATVGGWLGLALLVSCPVAAEEERAPLALPEGFHATLYADDPLAHDIFCMTIDTTGRVVVSGPGYIRALVDDDGDGRADRAETLVDGPATGAQGMFFDGDDLYCVGDGGVLRYRDHNGDGRWDESPQIMFLIRTGGEHHAHALRRGPDGCWYLLVGNDTGVNVDHAQGASPVQKPEAGALLRFAPNFSKCEVYADGFRNAYDFDFHPYGDVFVYDSDGERDVSLPWYQPTRVFHVLAGSHAGWLSRSWKRPDEYCDMPPVVARLGRGSPTGVVMYRHEAFPEPYRDALFVADWTFGRVVALPLKLDEATGRWKTEPIEFASSVGQFGFAPTDLEVGPDGSLFISVGGRGTRGGVYRITWNGDNSETLREENAVEADPQLQRCLGSPMPLSSFSRSRALTAAYMLGREQLEAAVINPQLPLLWRVRAVELATECFGGLSSSAHAALRNAPAPLRARAAWSIGRTERETYALDELDGYLAADEPLVVRHAAERLTTICLTMPSVANSDRFLRIAAHSEPSVRHFATMLPVADYQPTQWPAERQRVIQAELTTLRGRVTRRSSWNADVLQRAAEMWDARLPIEMQREIVRILQLAAGDMGPREGRAAVYDGYASRTELPLGEQPFKELVSKIEAWFPTGDEQLDNELIRLAAMIEANSEPLARHIVGRLNEESSPIDDLHALIALSRMPVALRDEDRRAVAHALVALEDKLDERSWRSDRNWDPRLAELYDAWLKRDRRMASELLTAPRLGHPGHVRLIALLSPELKNQARRRFAERLANDAEYPLSPQLVRELFALGDAEVERLVRERAEFGEARLAVIRQLAERASAEDELFFLEGLRSGDAELAARCLDALEKLPAAEDLPGQLAGLVQLLVTSSRDAEYAPLRERAARRLQQLTGIDHGFVLNSKERGRQDELVRRWVQWLHDEYPEQARRWLKSTANPATLLARFRDVPWTAGDPQRGRRVFERESCAACHRGRTALGPDLAGVARRFSREDLMIAIADPNRDVSSRYVATVIETHDGHRYEGTVIYDSVDGVTLLTNRQETIRVEATEIAHRATSAKSLMPEGLLAEATPQDIADLMAYLKTL